MARNPIVLNRNIAREIQSLAPSFADIMRRGFKSQLSRVLAQKYGVDPKTIRDIWDNRSWKRRGVDDEETYASFVANLFLSADEGIKS
jgi:hypothetical protein